MTKVMANALEQSDDDANLVDITDIGDGWHGDAVRLEPYIERDVQQFFQQFEQDYIHGSEVTYFVESLEIDLYLVHIHNLQRDLDLDSYDV